jgi:ABC-type phosphate transport system auxiliary subunit
VGLIVQQLELRVKASEEQLERHSRHSVSKREAVRATMGKLQESHQTLMEERQGVDAEMAKRQREIQAKENQVSSPNWTFLEIIHGADLRTGAR